VVGEYDYHPKFDDSRMWITVADPLGAIVYSKLASSEGKFAHTATVDGEYRACFSNEGAGHPQKIVTFDFHTGADAKDYSSVAKQGQLKPLEVELKRLEDMVISIHQEMEYLKEREVAMRATNDSTNGRLLWFSLISVLILVALAVLQLLYLRRYFLSRKLIQD